MHRRSASADVRQLGESLLEINARHERLISGLLLLARAEHEVTDRSPVDLADVVAHVVAQKIGRAVVEGKGGDRGGCRVSSHGGGRTRMASWPVVSDADPPRS